MYPKIPIQVIESDRVMLDAIVIAWEHHFLFVHFSSFFSTYIDNLMRIYFIITRRGTAVVGFTVTASIASTCDGLQQATSAIYGLFYSKHFGGFRSIQLGLFEPWHLIKFGFESMQRWKNMVMMSCSSEDFDSDLATKCHDCNSDVYPCGLWNFGQPLQDAQLQDVSFFK